MQSKKKAELALIVVADSNSHNGKSLKRSLSNTKTEANSHNGPLPEYLHPGSSERPLMALLPQTSQPEVRALVRVRTHVGTGLVILCCCVSPASQLFKGHIS